MEKQLFNVTFFIATACGTATVLYIFFALTLI